MHGFDRGLMLTPLSPDRFQATADAAYAMRTGPYGGWVTALLLNAALTHSGIKGVPVSMTVNFFAPINPGTCRVAVEVQNTTRTLCFLKVDIIHGSSDQESPAAGALIILGTRRGDLHIPQLTPPVDVTPADELESFTVPEGAPAVFHRYDIRYARGIPFAVNPDSRTYIYARDRPDRPLDYLSLAALCDVSLPRLYFLRPVRLPFATITLTIHFQGVSEDVAAVGTGLVLIDSVARQVRAGFFDQVCHLWSPTGALLATSEQMVWYKDA